MSVISNLLQKILKTGGGLLWTKVFKKFIKSFLVALGVAILLGILSALQAFIPEGALATAVWTAIGPALIGIVIAGLNAIKHWKDPPK